MGIHARRALIQLAGESSNSILVSSISQQGSDASVRNEFGKLFAMIGGSAIEPLCQYLQASSILESSCILSVESLYKIARGHPNAETR